MFRYRLISLLLGGSGVCLAGIASVEDIQGYGYPGILVYSLESSLRPPPYISFQRISRFLRRHLQIAHDPITIHYEMNLCKKVPGKKVTGDKNLKSLEKMSLEIKSRVLDSWDFFS